MVTIQEETGYLCFIQILKLLSTGIRCEEAGIGFLASSTTNGYYLTENIISDLRELNFVQFQITLDGNKAFHDKVKFQKGCDSAFTHVLKNINRLLSETEAANIFLRILSTGRESLEQIVLFW